MCARFHLYNETLLPFWLQANKIQLRAWAKFDGRSGSCIVVATRPEMIYTLNPVPSSSASAHRRYLPTPSTMLVLTNCWYNNHNSNWVPAATPSGIILQSHYFGLVCIRPKQETKPPRPPALSPSDQDGLEIHHLSIYPAARRSPNVASAVVAVAWSGWLWSTLPGKQRHIPWAREPGFNRHAEKNTGLHWLHIVHGLDLVPRHLDN